jgi:hypothetical protein
MDYCEPSLEGLSKTIKSLRYSNSGTTREHRIMNITNYFRKSCFVLRSLRPLDVSVREEWLAECEAPIIHKSRYRYSDCLSLAQVSFRNYSQTHAHTSTLYFTCKNKFYSCAI